ncbi:MAG TPA: hypothetical protein VKK61_10385, partial [Tepidisphaeraceae bacterium]|nr:hypothetical protein [Tepidisphaeraceae bacterium]
MKQPGWQSLLLISALLAGCSRFKTSIPPAEKSESPPIAVQMPRAVPELKEERFSNLLSFEAPTDAVFISASGLETSIDSSRANTGSSSLRVSGG